MITQGNADIAIRYDGRDYYFSLTQDEDGKRQWHVEDSKILPPMYVSDRPLFAHIPPEEEDVMEQNWFYAGFGEENFLHGKRYYSSSGCDARRKGAVLLSPKYAESTILSTTAATPTIVNGDFETGDTTGWTLSGTAVVNAASKRSGTYGLSLPAVGDYALSNAIAVDGTHLGRYYTVSVWPAIGVPTATISIITSTYTYSITTTIAAFASAATLSFVLPPGITSFQIKLTHTADGGDVYFDDLTIAAGEAGSAAALGSTIKIIDYMGSQWAACGKSLLCWNGTNWVQTKYWANTITDLCVWSSYLFICFGTANKYIYFDGGTSTTNTTFITSTIADGQMEFMGLVGETLWGNDTAYSVKAATNPINGGSWSTETIMINNQSDITCILSHPDRAIVAGTNFLIEVLATTEEIILPELEQENDSYTGHGLCLWKGKIYCATGLGSLYEIDIDNYIITTLTVSNDAPGMSDFVGRVCAMDGDADYLYTAIDDGTDIQMVCGRWEVISSETSFWWHHFSTITLTNASDNVNWILISSHSGVKRLWLGCVSATDGIYYLHHPTTYGDVTLDSNYKMLTTGTFTVPFQAGKYPYLTKSYYSVTVYCSNLSATKTIEVKYKCDLDSSFTSLGTLTSVNDNSLMIDPDLATRRLQLQFVLTSDSETSCPILTGYQIRAVAWPFDQDTGRLTINEQGEFRTYGGQDTSWEHSEYRDTPKNFYYITVYSSGASSTNYIKVEYKVDDDATYTQLVPTITESPYEVLAFPPGTVGKTLYLKFTKAVPASTNILTYIIDGILRPPKVKLFSFRVAVAENNPSSTGGMTEYSKKEIYDALREIDAGDWPVTMRTLFDDKEYQVTFQSMSEDILADERQGLELAFTVTAIEALV